MFLKYYKQKLIAEKRLFGRENFVFFWNTDGSAESCLSQWFPCAFVVEDVCYNSTEQYMMAQKAAVFGDTEIFAEIMASYNPGESKKLGRRVRNFDSDVWSEKSREVVLTGNLAKFTQNGKLRDYLLSTGDRILVEVSPFDVIWGIGYGAEAAEAMRPDLWRGENHLGFILMQVRDRLRADAGK